MAEEIAPGPCPVAGCPPPTQVDCIEVTRVYDFCYEGGVRTDVWFAMPRACAPLPPGASASATVAAAEAEVREVAPLAAGLANVTLLVAVRLDLQVLAPDGRLHSRLVGEFHCGRTLTLCAPPGVRVQCRVPGSSAGPVALSRHEMRVAVSFGLLLESTARARILVPSYGFCQPAPCVLLPGPPPAAPGPP